MKTIQIEGLKIIGLAVRTSNNNGEAASDIPALWGRFLAENTIAAIPNKVDDTVYCVYTNYEGDFTQPYTALLGCKVSSLSEIPEGFTGINIAPANYVLFTAKGNLNEGAVVKEWMNIWNSNLERAYVADFEVYGPKAANTANAEVDIYIGIKTN
jgi:predicted transcriptional regulator YdeE